MKTMHLKSIIYLSVLLLVACNTEVKKPTETNTPPEETKEETTVESASDKTEEETKDPQAEFAAMFPIVDSFPQCSKLLEISYNEDKREFYSAFSQMVKWDFFTDASEYEWLYQPLFQYKYGDSAFVLVALEYDEDTEVERFHLIRRELTWSDHREEYFMGTKWEIAIAEKRKGEVLMEYEFLNDKFDSVLIKQQNKPDHILYKFDDDFMDIKRFFALTRKEMDALPKEYKPDSIFPAITNGWSAMQQLDLIKQADVEQYREFSTYIHTKTHIDKTYTGYEVNYVPYVFPLGSMRVKDSLTLYVLYSDYFDNNEATKTVKILLCDGDLSKLIDYKIFVWVGEVYSNVEFSDNTFYFVDGDEIKMPMEFGNAGITPNKEYFKKLISKIPQQELPLTLFEEDLQGQEFVTVDGLNAYIGFFAKGNDGGVSCFGKIETESQVMILLNTSEEITSGEHWVYEQNFASVFDKETGAYEQNIMLNSRFDGVQSHIMEDSLLLFPAGEEHYSLVFGEDGNLYPSPTDTLIFTNYGCVKHYYVFPAEELADSGNILDWYANYNTTKLVRQGDFKCTETDTLKIFSNLLSSLIFNKKEANVVKYIPSTYKAINDTLAQIEWKRLDPNNYLFDSYGASYIRESGIYNKNTRRLKNIRKCNYIREL